MASKRRYNQWQKDPNFPIPKRTLTRMKKNSSSKAMDVPDTINFVDGHVDRFHEVTGLAPAAFEGNEHTNIFSSQEEGAEDWENGSNFDDSDQQPILNNEVPTYQNLSEPYHLIEDEEFRDCDIDISMNQSGSETESSDEDDLQSDSVTECLYAGSAITIQDSILSIMKYSLHHKTTYAALSDLLNLITIHLPSNSQKEHLQSLYFLKKVFAAQTVEGETENTDTVKIM